MKAFLNFLKQDIYKFMRSNSSRVILASLIVLVIIDGVFAIQNYHAETAVTLAIPKDDNGFYTEDPWIGVATLYNCWIGGRTGGVLPLLFYFLLPVYCVIPYSWSYLSEEKSGYIKLICSKLGKPTYFFAKYLSAFLSGFFIVVLPQLVSVLFISCFVPAYQPDMMYALYYQVDITKMWGDLYYSMPFLYITFYILVSSVFGGIWATVPIAVSMYNNNKFASLFAPYIVLLFLISSGEQAIVLREYFAISPLSYIRPTLQGQAEYPWILAVEMLTIGIATLTSILWKGGKKDVY